MAEANIKLIKNCTKIGYHFIMKQREKKSIRFGLTEQHGMTLELTQFPPNGVKYMFLKKQRVGSRIFKSPLKGYMSNFDFSDCDIIESVMSPVITDKPWIYSLAVFEEALAWNLMGIPLPKIMRKLFIQKLFMKENCKKIVFWSQAGKNTLKIYGNLPHRIKKKIEVVYPAIRYIPDEFVKYNSRLVNILFSGTFFIKGGIHVIDAFERAQKLYRNIRLWLCCDKITDFFTPNKDLQNKYLQKIESNKDILLIGRVSRDIMLNEVLPNSDIYLLPTYLDAFGFAILEAMAYGIPVIATNYMAIPEMVQDGVNGYLIDISDYETRKIFKGCLVNEIPESFNDYVTERLFQYLCLLIDSATLRKTLGFAGIEIARTKFSFRKRNAKMKKIYEEALR